MQVRRLLLAILDEADRPVPTPEMLAAMARRAGCNGQSAEPACPLAGGAHDSCPAWCWHQRVYPQLRALANLGLVQRIRVPCHRCVYWRRIDNDTDEAMNRLFDGEAPAQR